MNALGFLAMATSARFAAVGAKHVARAFTGKGFEGAFQTALHSWGKGGHMWTGAIPLVGPFIAMRKAIPKAYQNIKEASTAFAITTSPGTGWVKGGGGAKWADNHVRATIHELRGALKGTRENIGWGEARVLVGMRKELGSRARQNISTSLSDLSGIVKDAATGVKHMTPGKVKSMAKLFEESAQSGKIDVLGQAIEANKLYGSALRANLAVVGMPTLAGGVATAKLLQYANDRTKRAVRGY